MRGSTAERWGSAQIGLHWTIAELVLLIQVSAGITMVSVGPGTVQNRLDVVAHEAVVDIDRYLSTCARRGVSA